MKRRVVRKARGQKKLVAFEVLRRKERTSKRIKEFPNVFFRQAIAKNLSKIEKRFGRLARSASGAIIKPLGGGMYGLVFNLENGHVLKVTKDPTEAANAQFWLNAQRRNSKLLRGVAKVYGVAKSTFKTGRKKSKRIPLGFIEREFIKTPSPLPVGVEAGLDQFVDNFLIYCASDSEEEQTYSMALAREGLSLLALDAPFLRDVMDYAWNRGIPQIDASSHNVGVRVHKVGKKTKSGDIVIFDFGLHVSDCWQVLNQKAFGGHLLPKDYLLRYDKQVTRL
jgi:hypothetical protein